MLCSSIDTPLAARLGRYDATQVVVVADAAIVGYMPALLRPFPLLTLAPDGGSTGRIEDSKSLDAVQRIWDFLLAQHITRRGLMVCVGGGVVTDLGGFAAATYKRGIDYINIPTTLLSMVDASTGGKTGFNYHGIKNAIGAFYSPVDTLVCPQWLHTLPVHELLSGYAEMLKTGLIDTAATQQPGGERLWDRLLQYDLDRLDIEPLTPLIAECLAVKDRIVRTDPHEAGLRKALNLGHTFGHAIEEVALSPITNDPSPLPHGYAVLYGMVAELYLSVVQLGLRREVLQQMTQYMLHYYGRPQCRCSDRDQLVRLMYQDKKNEQAGQINCTLLSAVGQPAINQFITREQADEAWEYLFSL